MKTLKQAILITTALALVAFAQVSELSEKPSAPALSEPATANEIVAPADLAKPDSTADTLSARERPEEPMATCLTIGNGSDDIFIDVGTAGNVGIGTASPSFKTTVSQDMTMSGDINPGSAQLSVEGASVPGKRMILGYDTNSNGFGYIKAGNYGVTWTNLALQPNGGNVGIGTTSPGYKLHVNGSIYGSTVYAGSAENYMTTNTGYLGFHTNSNEMTIGAGSNTLYLNYRAANGTTVTNYIWNAGSSTSWATHNMGNLNVNGQGYFSGNVGIGTTSPGEKLSVSGRISLTTDPNSGDDAMDRDYADNRYVRNEGNYAMTMSANFCYSPDDISGFTTLSGDDNYVSYTMPFSITMEGNSYNSITISTNGWISFGGSPGSSVLGNTSLPTSTFSMPAIFPYWDDLVTNGNHVRYGSVGSSPNRTVVVDFECRTYSDSYNVRFQVQIHEGSGLINVKYRHEMAPAANGQSATIGFQLAGGSSAKAYPITYNGKVLDDNRDDSEGWSVCPVR